MPEPKLHVADALHCAATLEDAFIVVWRDSPSAARIRALKPALEEVLARNPNGIGYVVVMEARNPMPEPEARAAGTELFKWMGERCRFQTVIVEAGGLSATLMRAMLRSFAMLTGHQKTHVAQDVGDACEWSAPRLKGFTPARLAETIARVRACYAEAAPRAGQA